MQRIYRCALFAMLGFGVLVPSAWGAGLWLYEQGTPDLGTKYRFADSWLWSVGAAYDSLPTDEDTRTPDLPLDRQIRIGTGIQYDWSADVTVGAAYEYLDAGDAEIDQDGRPLQGPLKGEYDANAIHFFAVNLIWKF